MKQNFGEFSNVILNLSANIASSLSKIDNNIKEDIQEIRIRVNKSVVIFASKRSFFLGEGGLLSQNDPKTLIVNQNDMLETLKIICNFSIYSFQNQIKDGFVTLKGGHRVGLCGTAVIDDGKIINTSDISSINLRIAKQIPGCSDKIFEKFGTNLGGTLIVGPPSSGKTTILRDIAKRLSTSYEEENLIKITIIDERREIASVFQGVPQNDIGFSDVLNGFPKSDGIMRALRTLSPKIVICDEIGNNDDSLAIKELLNCGMGIIASIHADSIDEISNSIRIKNIINSGAIKRIVLLGSIPGEIKGMFELKKNEKD